MQPHSLRLKHSLPVRISQSTTITDAQMWNAVKTVSVSHMIAPHSLFAKHAQILMHQVASKSVREINAKIISNVSSLFVTKDTVMRREVEIGEEEETMAFRSFSFYLSSSASCLLYQ